MKISKIFSIISIIILSIAVIASLSINVIAVDEPDTNTDNNNVENNQSNTTDDENNNDNQSEEPPKQDDDKEEENNPTDGNNNNNNQEDNNTPETNKPEDDKNEEPEENKNTSNEEPKEEQNNNKNNNTNKKDNNKSNTNTNNKTETKSDNANLKSLTVTEDNISPEFNKDVTEYSVVIDLTVEELEIEAAPEDKNAKIVIKGNSDLQEGENTIQIVVTAEAGNTKTYIIHVTKTDNIEEVNAKLKSLSIKGFSIYPDFKNDIYTYNLTLEEKVSQLDISAETEVDGATYEIVGNSDLKEGDNQVKIIVTAKDGETKREYEINVFMISKAVQAQKTNIVPAIIMLLIVGSGIVGVSIAMARKK